MKDILLIDDNSRNQRSAYGAAFVDNEEYESILSHIEQVPDDIDPSFMCDCKCVLIHDSLEDFKDGSFNQYSHKAKDIIVDYLEDGQIPYVCFSDGHESLGVFDSCRNLVSVKKSEFYNRLKYFLDYYLEGNKIEFNILAYGRNFRKEVMLRYVKALFKKLEMKRPSETLLSSDVMPFKISPNSIEENYLESIVSLAQPSLGMSYNDILEYVDDKEISVGEFRKKINNILDSVSKYGKNTYTWK